MYACSSHLIQSLDVSCFEPLKKTHGSQIEIKTRLGANHINKEEFLPAFFAAHQQTMSQKTIMSGFKATDLIPFNPETVLARLGAIVEATSQSSQTSWDPKTPKKLPKIKN